MKIGIRPHDGKATLIPFEANRSCVLGYYEPLQHYESLAALRDTWIDSTMSELHIKAYLTNYTYHSTGLEGNTLTLRETYLVIDNVPLFTGLADDKAIPFSP